MDMLTLNCNALVSLSYAFLKRAESGDTLVNIASVLGITSLPGAATYVGTKGFVILFSESLWYEYKKRGIHVMAFCPGITSSNFYESSGGIEGNYPGILVQTPEQVAKDVVRAIGKRNRPVVIGGIKNALGRVLDTVRQPETNSEYHGQVQPHHEGEIRPSNKSWTGAAHSSTVVVQLFYGSKNPRPPYSAYTA